MAGSGSPDSANLLFFSDRPLFGTSSSAALPSHQPFSGPTPSLPPLDRQTGRELSELELELHRKKRIMETAIAGEQQALDSLNKNVDENIHGNVSPSLPWYRKGSEWVQRKILHWTHTDDTIIANRDLIAKRLSEMQERLGQLDRVIDGSNADPNALTLPGIQRALQDGSIERARQMMAVLHRELTTSPTFISSKEKLDNDYAASHALKEEGKLRDAVLTKYADWLNDVPVEGLEKVFSAFGVGKLVAKPAAFIPCLLLRFVAPIAESISAECAGIDLTKLDDERHNKSLEHKIGKGVLSTVADITFGRFVGGWFERFGNTTLTTAGGFLRPITRGFQFLAAGFLSGASRRASEIGVERAMGEHKATGIEDVEDILASGSFGAFTAGISLKLEAFKAADPGAFFRTLGEIKNAIGNRSFPHFLAAFTELTQRSGLTVLPLVRIYLSAMQSIQHAARMDQHSTVKYPNFKDPKEWDYATYENFQSPGQIWETSKKEVFEELAATLLWSLIGKGAARP